MPQNLSSPAGKPVSLNSTPGLSLASSKAFIYFMLIVGAQGFLGKFAGFFIPLYFDELGFSGVQIGIYFSFASIATILLSLPMGISTDKKPITYIFILSFVLSGLSYIGFLYSKSYIIFCLFAFLGSFGTRFFVTGRDALFFKITTRDSPDQAARFNLVLLAFTGAGMILGGYVIKVFGFWQVFMVAAVGNFLLVGFSFFIPRTETVAIKLAEYKKELFKPNVIFLCIIFFLSSLHWGAEAVAYPRFLHINLQLEYNEVGIYTGVGFFVVGLGALLGAFLIKRKLIKNLQSLLMAGFLLSGVFHVLMCFGNVYLSFMFRCIHEIGDGITLLAFYFGIPRIFKIQTIGGCAAFISLWMSIGAFSSSVFFGYVGDQWGNQWPLIISGVVLALIPLLILGRQKYEAHVL